MPNTAQKVRPNNSQSDTAAIFPSLSVIVYDNVLYHSLFSIAALGDRIEEGT
jgi:hypothetical protein